MRLRVFFFISSFMWLLLVSFYCSFFSFAFTLFFFRFPPFFFSLFRFTLLPSPSLLPPAPANPFLLSLSFLSVSFPFSVCFCSPKCCSPLRKGGGWGRVELFKEGCMRVYV
ncbi:hypothetical protein DFJ73DRAFT_881612 [Zopfochytrium polystomum]|nr:hypothetical protein DFJ73DRAFT_881612 [Zopfochytrium polystomum]